MWELWHSVINAFLVTRCHNSHTHILNPLLADSIFIEVNVCRMPRTAPADLPTQLGLDGLRPTSQALHSTAIRAGTGSSSTSTSSSSGSSGSSGSSRTSESMSRSGDSLINSLKEDGEFLRISSSFQTQIKHCLVL